MCSKISRMEGYTVDKLSFAARVARMFSLVALIATLGAYRIHPLPVSIKIPDTHDDLLSIEINPTS